MAEALPGRYRVRPARLPRDLQAAQALRHRCFRARGSAPDAGLDADAFDARAEHILIEETASGNLVACLRATAYADGSEIAGSYSAQFYGLAALACFNGPMLEVGRFCVAPGHRDPDIIRLAWGALAAKVEATKAELLFGCTSFAGIEAEAYRDAFALLGARHLAPRRWRPRVKAPAVVRFARQLRFRRPDMTAAMRAMPPLLRSYLALGGWVSDHAVIDRDLGTLHVFTGLEIRAMPPGRVSRLRALAGA